MLRHLDLIDDIAFGQILERPGQMLRIDAPVSYTHLDVYKRQLRTGANF